MIALISLEKDPAVKTTLKLDYYGEDKGYASQTIGERALTVKDPERLTLPIYGMVHDDGNTGFYTIIEEQTKNKMVAEASPDYAFVAVSPSMLPEEKSEPNRILICILGFWV